MFCYTFFLVWIVYLQGMFWVFNKKILYFSVVFMNYGNVLRFKFWKNVRSFLRKFVSPKISLCKVLDIYNVCSTLGWKIKNIFFDTKKKNHDWLLKVIKKFLLRWQDGIKNVCIGLKKKTISIYLADPCKADLNCHSYDKVTEIPKNCKMAWFVKKLRQFCQEVEFHREGFVSN